MKTEIIERLLCLLDVRMHALALCEVSRGTRLKLPAMEAVMVHYVLRGQGVLRSDDGAKVDFGPDSLLYLPPGCSHEIAETGDEPELIVWKDIATPVGDGMMKFADGGDPVIINACGTITADCEGLDLFSGLRESIVVSLAGDPCVRSAFEIMIKELQGPRFGTKPLLEALMKQCLILSLRNQAERGELLLFPLLGGGDPRLVQALLELLEDPAREHTVEELAAASGMSRSLFSERFSEAFDRPPMDLLKQIRLHRAASLLRATNLPVQVIGLTVGYVSRSYFSRAFKSAYGRDPRTFRDEARAQRPVQKTDSSTISGGADHAGETI
ncbi:MAG: AraC family transcriptional regulator [Pseudomonadota bacterium]|nr:AraC family transcriptional regulator [Pseudomonadota bacterium]